MSREVLAAHDRMLGALIMPGKVVAVDLTAAKVRMQSRDWVSPWVSWHSQAAGKARHWRAPSLGERGALFSASGEPSVGTFVGGLFSEAGAQPDNRDHVEVWRFDDGGSLVYDWEAKTYTITLPTGTVTLQVGASTVVVTDNAVDVTASNISLNGKTVINGETSINGPLSVTGDVTATGTIMDAGGNSNHHTH